VKYIIDTFAANKTVVDLLPIGILILSVLFINGVITVNTPLGTTRMYAVYSEHGLLVAGNRKRRVYLKHSQWSMVRVFRDRSVTETAVLKSVLDKSVDNDRSETVGLRRKARRVVFGDIHTFPNASV